MQVPLPDTCPTEMCAWIYQDTWKLQYSPNWKQFKFPSTVTAATGDDREKLFICTT